MSEGALPIVAAIHTADVAHMHVVRLKPALPRATRSTWFLSPAVFVLAAGATFLTFYLRTGAVAASTPRLSPLLDPRGASLDLRVETQGLGLRLSWNRYSPAIQTATSGVLEIDDGGQRREIPLDVNQIVNGSVVYRPASDDVSFRLNLHGSSGKDVAQVLRVLDASPKPIAPQTASSADAVKTGSREITTDRQRTRPHADAEAAPNSPNGQNHVPQNFSQKPAASAASAPAIGTTASPSTEPLFDVAAALQKPAEIQPPAVSVPKPVPAPATTPQSNVEAIPPSPSLAKKPEPVAAYIPPRPLKWVQPNANPAEPVDIRVKVKIDDTGRVTAAHALIDGGKRDKKLMAAAAAAVKQWIFEPAKSYGANVASEETIVVHVGPEAQ